MRLLSGRAPIGQHLQSDNPPANSTVDLLFEEAKRAVSAQDAQFSALDTKTGFVLTAASLIVGFGYGGLPGVVLLDKTRSSSEHASADSSWASTLIWLIPSLGIYFLLVVSALLAYQVAATYRAPNPDGLAGYLYDDDAFVKRRLIAAMTYAYKQNEQVILKKLTYLRIAQSMLVIEALYWIVAVVFIRMAA